MPSSAQNIKYMKKYVRICLFLVSLSPVLVHCQEFTVARIHYGGGGDWYCDPSSLPNLLDYLHSQTGMAVTDEVQLKLTDQELHNYPYLYITGHGNLRFSDEEVLRLREFLLRGAFLHVDDNYGLDESFRREMQRVFPNRELVELPHDHLIFSSYYEFSNGLPKIHEHDNKPPQGFGIFDGDRLMVFYTYETDLGDGWEDEEVHHDPALLREAALKMGVNIIWYALTQ